MASSLEVGEDLWRRLSSTVACSSAIASAAKELIAGSKYIPAAIIGRKLLSSRTRHMAHALAEQVARVPPSEKTTRLLRLRFVDSLSCRQLPLISSIVRLHRKSASLLYALLDHLTGSSLARGGKNPDRKLVKMFSNTRWIGGRKCWLSRGICPHTICCKGWQSRI